MAESPKMIKVELEVKQVRPVEGGVCVHGFVGDNSVTVWFSSDEARTKELI